MLYQRWCRTARERPRALALREGAGGRDWTFGELAAAGAGGGGGSEAMVCPQAGSAAFVVDVLRAWRTGRIVCPLEPGQSPPRMEEPLPAGIVHLKTTSGTEGQARRIAFTGAQLAADADNIVSTMGLRADWPNVGVVSLAHSYGFSNLVLPLLLHGVPLIMADSALPESLRRVAGTQREITLAAVPALWRAWLEAGVIPGNVRLAVSAAAPLPLALELAVFERCGLKIHNFYGSSECGGIAFDAGQTPRRDESCAGAPLRGVSCKVGETGCLEVHSAAVGQGGWPQPCAALRPGVFETGDLAALTEGLVYLQGRMGDQINVAGRKVSPETVERILLEHPSVRECVVFGVPSGDAARGEWVAACVVLGPAGNGREIRAYLQARLPAWQVPREWRFVEKLAPNPRGKLSRRALRERFFPMPQEPSASGLLEAGLRGAGRSSGG